MNRSLLLLGLALQFLVACSSSGGDSNVSEDVPGEITVDVVADVSDVQNVDPEMDRQSEETLGKDSEVLDVEIVEDGLPQSLPLDFTREMKGEPVSDEEITAFTRRITGLLARAHYFDWVLYTSHGVPPESGMKDFIIWWTGVHAEKSGDVVTFVHNETNAPDRADGGHNLMTRTSKVISAAIAGYLLTGDETMRMVVEGYCKGISSMMLGMVYDENDPLHHLMARNVVMFNYQTTTHDGKTKAVDYSNWYHDGEGWNTQRFEYPNNPYWGSVWVTNMRSKDDVSRLYRASGMIRYAIEKSGDPGIEAACGETYDLLQKFAQDIAEHDYVIRSKDENGNPILPGVDHETEWPMERTDLSDYTTFDSMFPLGQCSAKRSVNLLAYGDGGDLDCGPGYGSGYEPLSVEVHHFNMGIIRAHHISHLFLTLMNRDTEAALGLLQGLAQRFEESIEEKISEGVSASWDEWQRDLATHLLQSTAVGYPLNWDEVRLVHKYYGRSVDKLKDWPHWDLWADSVSDGSYEYKPPDREGEEPDRVHWVRPEDLATILDSCWSPFHNPAGARVLDCDIVRDPASWDPAWADE